MGLSVRLVFCALSALSVGSCARHDAAGGTSAAGVASPLMTATLEAPMAPGARALQRNDSLAYEHSIVVALSKELLPTRIQELQAACAAAKDFSCTLLDVTTGAYENVPNGGVRLRLSPPGVEPMIALASKGGEIRSRRTHAEDLAEPVADLERELSQLTTHRDRLQELMKAKDIKIDSLITVSRELASVQSRIDAVATQKAGLRRRIDTELLSIDLRLTDYAAATEQTPVLDAFRSFGSHFKEAIANVISFLAMALPWIVLLVPALILLRFFWRWISRWIARREARAAAR